MTDSRILTVDGGKNISLNSSYVEVERYPFTSGGIGGNKRRPVSKNGVTDIRSSSAASLPALAPAGTEGQKTPNKRAAESVAQFMGSCTRGILWFSGVETVVLSRGVSPVRQGPCEFVTKAGGFGEPVAFERILWEMDSERKQT